MSDRVTIPTKVRVMNSTEYRIVKRVFGDTLPYSWRIFITNGAGLNGRAFTIPTSLVSALVPSFAGILAGYLSSVVNAGYIINVGDKYSSLSGNDQRLLVHETAHVWQGKNSTFALTYVFKSCLDQCVRGSGAYRYTPGQSWASYGVEQQASIIEQWFVDGEPQSGDLWGYIRDYVRKGKTS